jgi:hypothetical protein
MNPLNPDDLFSNDWGVPQSSNGFSSQFSDPFFTFSPREPAPPDFGPPDALFDIPFSPAEPPGLPVDFLNSPDPIAPPPRPYPDSGHQRVPSNPVRAPNPLLLGAASFPASLVARDLGAAQFRTEHTRQHSLPTIAVSQTLTSDAEFAQICNDRNIKFNPRQMGFIPRNFWANQEFTFGELVSDFFQRKNNSNSRFSHKLYNALKIANEDSFYVEFLGVEWVTDNVLKIDKRVFARLLAIQTIDGSLFHQQGNFPSHGFVELSERDARAAHLSDVDLEGVDYENVRLLTHQPGIFIKDCTEDDIARCKWVSPRRRTEPA